MTASLINTNNIKNLVSVNDYSELRIN